MQDKLLCSQYTITLTWNHLLLQIHAPYTSFFVSIFIDSASSSAKHFIVMWASIVACYTIYDAKFPSVVDLS